MFSMIEFQESIVARLNIANSKQGKRSAGLRFARTKGAVRSDAIRTLAKRGYAEDQAAQIVRDAFDMFRLERDAA